MRHLCFCLLGLTACGVSASDCRGRNEADGTEGRSVFAYPLGLEPTWPVAVGDRLPMSARSSGDAPLLVARSSDPGVLQVISQQPRVVQCSSAADACEPDDPGTWTSDRWTVTARREGRAELRLETTDGRLHDRLVVSVARPQSLEVTEWLATEQDPSLDRIAASSTDGTNLQLFSARARDAKGRPVAIYCGVRVRIDDTAVAKVIPGVEPDLCPSSDDASMPAGSFFVVEAVAAGETRLRLSSAELETVVPLVVE